MSETPIKELDDVILACDLPEHGLSAGDNGTVVLVHHNAAGYEVEFTALDGDTIAVVTLMANQSAQFKLVQLLTCAN